MQDFQKVPLSTCYVSKYIESMAIGGSQQCVHVATKKIKKIVQLHFKIYPHTYIEPKYGAFCMNNKVSVH